MIETPVSALEDLMREHGVLWRALLVYRESAAKLRRDAAGVDAPALHRTGLLFRAFGEDYHEKQLEEGHVFPQLRKAGGPAADLVDLLIAQHDRGREITDYILAATGGATIGDAATLARVLDEFDRMHQNHTAREDTIVFPAWAKTLSREELHEIGEELHEIGEEFEEIEHRQFGEGGCEHAVRQIGEIEQTLGIADLALFTAPVPSKG
jgi:hemerythrin-like domain-containing protein